MGQQNPPGKGRAATSIGFRWTVTRDKVRWAARPRNAPQPLRGRLELTAKETETDRSRPGWATVVGEPDVGKPPVRFDEGTAPEEAFLLYLPTFFNSRREPLSRWGVTYVLQKYVSLARRITDMEFPAKVSPHVLRHSTAVPMLQSGVNLIRYSGLSRT